MRPAYDGADLEIVGRIDQASNGTYLARQGSVPVVYKPVSGERPLWDFPDLRLAQREVAAHAVSEALGWNVVPATWLQDGPLGVGMVQEWREPSAEIVAIEVVDLAEADRDGWLRVLDAVDAVGRPVSLVHEDTRDLRRIALFDVITNNADRKGSHVIVDGAGHRLGVDHGLTFHTDPKLRTVLWGWIGQEMLESEMADVTALLEDFDSALRPELEELLTLDEIDALCRRCSVLLDSATFPAPDPHGSALPWPLI